MVEWLKEIENNDKPQSALGPSELVQLHRNYLTRQLHDLDSMYRHANLLLLALTPLLLGFVYTLAKHPNEGITQFVYVIPFICLLLIHEGKLTTVRYYRRYIEGRVQVTKVEYALGLLGPIQIKKTGMPASAKPDLWKKEGSFLPNRHYAQPMPYESSRLYIYGCLHKYGVGGLVMRIYNVLYFLSWLVFVGFPLILWICRSELNLVASWSGIWLGGVFFGLWQMYEYGERKEKIIDETISREDPTRQGDMKFIQKKLYGPKK